MYNVRQGSNFILLYVTYICPGTIYWKDSSFSTELSGIVVKNQFTISVRVCFWTVNFILVNYLSISMLIPHYLDYYTFVYIFKMRVCASSNFLLFPGCFSYSEPLAFHIFRISFCRLISAKKKKKRQLGF